MKMIILLPASFDSFTIFFFKGHAFSEIRKLTVLNQYRKFKRQQLVTSRNVDKVCNLERVLN